MARVSLLCLGFAAGLALSAAASGAAAEELTYNSWLPSTDVANEQGVVPFFESVKEATDGELTGKIFYAGQMATEPETLSSIRNGIVNSGFVYAAGRPKELPYNSIFAGLQGLNQDPLVALAANLETVLVDCPDCEEEAKRNNIVILGGHATAPYYLTCNREINSVGDLQGLRFRATSAYYADVARHFGMTIVNMPFADILPALERGQLDCILSIEYYLGTSGLSEVMKSIVTTRHFGTLATAGLFTFNRNTWNGLDPAEKEAILRAIPEAVTDVTLTFNNQSGPALEKAVADGVQTVELSDDFVQSWQAFIEAETEKVIADSEALGAKNARAAVEAYQANLDKWAKIVTETKGDVDAYKKALWDEIFSKMTN
ncbi:C4-dicarboxylate TRAP transporter substrate-binding protein [Amorphus sp. 3PC139-8]|uniref:C4-dicarboxylate TRAP transporter substrate-binding protein n=1 Tax=Amorphus sp. 3PC139-8 TaxID=2735676 RepID=UPI00345CE536